MFIAFGCNLNAFKACALTLFRRYLWWRVEIMMLKVFALFVQMRIHARQAFLEFIAR